MAVLAASLGGCSTKGVFGWPESHWKDQEFKPYVEKQGETIPAAADKTAWMYQPGVDPSAVARQLRESRIINSVVLDKGGLFERHYRQSLIGPNIKLKQKPYAPVGKRRFVHIGPNFYNLSEAGRKQVLSLTDTMYKLSEQPEIPVYLYDDMTKKVVGEYNNATLNLY